MTIYMAIAMEYFLHFKGQHGARLTRVQSVRGKEKGLRTWLIKIFSPLLFGAPDTHLEGLEEVWLDREIVMKNSWKDLVEKLQGEWEQFVLFSTVLLNANVAFLALPNADMKVGANAFPVEITCQVSIIASMGSIVIGLLLGRQHRINTDAAAEAVNMARYRPCARTDGIQRQSI